MYYTKQQMDQWAGSGSTGTANLTAVMSDWLEQDAKITQLRDAVAAVVEAWEEGCWQTTGWNHQQDINAMESRIDALRLAAGIDD